jgi:hypothetical protein
MNDLLNFKNCKVIIKTDIITYNPFDHQISDKYINPFINLTDDLMLIENEYKFNTTLGAYWLNITKINNFPYSYNPNKKIDLYDLTKTYTSVSTLTNKCFMIHLCDKCLRYSFGHYIFNLFPVLYYYRQYHYDMQLCLSKRIYNSILKNLINILQIDNNKITILEDEILYLIDDIYTYKLVNTDWIFKPVKWLLEYVKPKEQKYDNPNKILYISYRSNNKYTARKVNNSEIEAYCLNNNIDVLDMSVYSIEEKARILPQYETIIVLYGSGSNNIIFDFNIKNIILMTSRPMHEAHGSITFEWLNKTLERKINNYYYIHENGSLDTNSEIILDIKWLDDILNLIKLNVC